MPFKYARRESNLVAQLPYRVDMGFIVFFFFFFALVNGEGNVYCLLMFQFNKILLLEILEDCIVFLE